MALSFAGLMAPEAHSQQFNSPNGIHHVLLISIDGMHALDYQNCVSGGTCPTLAALGKTGVTYTRTSTSLPSDSFPGLINIVTGGTPRSHGAFYDVAYDRVFAPPLHTTGNGVAGGKCTPGQPNGTTTEYEEGDDIDQTKLNGGAPGASLTDGGVKSTDPTRLVRDPNNACQPVYPGNFIGRTRSSELSMPPAATPRGPTSIRSITLFRAPAMAPTRTITTLPKSIPSWWPCRESLPLRDFRAPPSPIRLNWQPGLTAFRTSSATTHSRSTPSSMRSTARPTMVRTRLKCPTCSA